MLSSATLTAAGSTARITRGGSSTRIMVLPAASGAEISSTCPRQHDTRLCSKYEEGRPSTCQLCMPARPALPCTDTRAAPYFVSYGGPLKWAAGQ